MENEKEVVNQEDIDLTPDSEVEKTQKQDTEGEGEPDGKPAKGGDKTDPNLLLKSLKEERIARQNLENENARLIKELNTPNSSQSDEEFSEEGKALKQEIKQVNQKLADVLEKQELKEVYATFTGLKGLEAAFDEYRKEFPRHKIANVAKLFLSEKGLLDKPRKGLEKSTGGEKANPANGMTSEEAHTLMTTNFKLYQKLIKEGKLKIIK